MKRDFWVQRWKKSEIGFHQQEINSHLQQYWGQLQLVAGSQVFVPLCGKSQDMLWLRAQGFRVLGVELSEIAVSDFFAESGLQPEVVRDGVFNRWQVDGLTILQGDLFELTSADLQDCVAIFDRASLIALPVEMRERYVEHIFRLFPAQVEMLLIALEYPQNEMEGPPFSVQEEEVSRLYRSRFSIETLLDIDILHESPRFQQKGVSYFIERVYRLCCR
ncbi:MAG: thiopurine S-methyltransferase [Candidatus Polarisedimenticolaceae bacterium]|nr:thiopurine S-methyltransferase [Candidatus Polarisedimenticolaceae bacterium]